MADEDGWITVTKGSRTSAPESKKMREDEPLSHQDEKRKQKKVCIYALSIMLHFSMNYISYYSWKKCLQVDVAFYNFQIKESKMKRQLCLTFLLSCFSSLRK